MPRNTNSFPSVWQAVLLVVGLILAEVLIASALRDARGWLGLDEDGLDALAVLLGSGAVLAMASSMAGISDKQLFHPSPSSAKATAVLLVLPVLALVPALVLVIGSAVELLEDLVPMSRWEEAMFARFASGSLPMIVMVCILAPVLEEMLYRGVMLRGFLTRFPRWQAFWVSSLLFGAAHFNLYQFVTALPMGLLLAWLYERFRSLIPCIVLHAGFNTAVTALHLGDEQAQAWSPSLLAWLASLACAGMGVWVLRAILRPAPRAEVLVDESAF